MVDFVDIVDFVDYVDFLKTSEKELTFIFLYSKYIILRIIGERERFYSNTRNFNNNNNNINIRNELKVATMKFFGNYKFCVYLCYKYINIYE